MFYIAGDVGSHRMCETNSLTRVVRVDGSLRRLKNDYSLKFVLVQALRVQTE